VRRSARLVILDPDDRLLLFRYEDGREPPFWATPGGEVLPGETFEQAAARELAAETGFAAALGRHVRTREAVFAAGDVGLARWVEHYFVVRAAGGAPERGGWTAEERRTIREARWWPLAELRAGDVRVLPDWIPDVLAALVDESHPKAGQRIAAADAAARNPSDGAVPPKPSRS
jgi:ADP-ribose pyrophosphatase YjhB (NUDIX family)